MFTFVFFVTVVWSRFMAENITNKYCRYVM